MKFRKAVLTFLSVCLTVSAIGFQASADMSTASDVTDTTDGNEMTFEECEEIADRIGKEVSALSESNEDASPAVKYITVEEMDAIKRVVNAEPHIIVKEDMSALSDTGCNFYSKYFYNQLSAGLKDTYSKMQDTILSYELSGADVESSGFLGYVDFPANTTRQEAEDFVCLFFYSNPRFYFIEHAYSLSTNMSGTYAYSVAISCYEDFRSGKARTTATNKIGAVVKNILAETSAMSSPVEKETYIARYICDHTEYIKSGHHQSAYGSLVENIAVCAGYTNAYNMLCNAAGVECISIHSPNHAWNMTNLYGNWYCTDVTWMDGYSKNGMYVESWHDKSYSTFLTNSLTSTHKDAHDIMPCLDGFILPDCVNDSVIMPDAGIAIDEDNFPDPIFRQYVLDNFDTDNDGALSESEIMNVTEINVDGFNSNTDPICSLKGIEFFSDLIYLNCNYQAITELDVSANTKLLSLFCGQNDLSALDVSNNKELKELNCSVNHISALNVDNNKQLEYLCCADNQIESLNVSNNTKLYNLQCAVNKIGKLDLSKNTALESLWCGGNQLTALDVSKNTALETLYCYSNQLTTLDVSKNTALEILNCVGNQLTKLDVSKNTALTGLSCAGNQLTTLDVSKNTALTGLTCSDNQLTTLDVSKNTALEYLECEFNQLTTLDVSKNTALETLYCEENQLTSLDLSQNTALMYLYCYMNQFTTLDLRNNSLLINIATDPDITICAEKGSAAEEYAKEHGIAFIAADPSDTVVASGTITVSGDTEAIAGTKLGIKNSDGTACGANIEIASDGTFTVTGTLPDGDYTITANKSKCCPRDYTVTVSGGQMSGELDVELQLYGDVDNNGIVTLDDVIDVINYFNKKTSAISSADKGTQDYLIAVSDVDGDGVIKLDDAIEMINYFNKKASAFDKIA